MLEGEIKNLSSCKAKPYYFTECETYILCFQQFRIKASRFPNSKVLESQLAQQGAAKRMEYVRQQTLCERGQTLKVNFPKRMNQHLWFGRMFRSVYTYQIRNYSLTAALLRAWKSVCNLSND
jgi:hypothetical protein